MSWSIDWIPSVLAAFTAWTCLYVTSKLLDTSHGWEWHCRRVTMLHALVITALSGWSAFIDGPWPFTDPAGPNTVLQHWTAVTTLGYFIFDQIWCLYFNTEGKMMLFHHFLSIFGNLMVLTRGINGCELMATLFGTEISNPLLQFRWFLRQSPIYKDSWFAVAVDISFIVVFTIMRICVASALLYSYLTHPRPDFLARFGSVAIYVVGWVFWFSIIRYGITKYARGKRHNSSRQLACGEAEIQSTTTSTSSTHHNGYHGDDAVNCRNLNEIRASAISGENVLHKRTVSYT